MKLAFSTLGCLDFSWPEIYSMASDFGFDGIEIRGLGKDIFAVEAQPFTEEQLPKTINKLSELGIEDSLSIIRLLSVSFAGEGRGES